MDAALLTALQRALAEVSAGGSDPSEGAALVGRPVTIKAPEEVWAVLSSTVGFALSDGDREDLQLMCVAVGGKCGEVRTFDSSDGLYHIAVQEKLLWLPRAAFEPMAGDGDGQCPKGHPLCEHVTPNNSFGCDACLGKVPQATRMYGCRCCNYDECLACHEKGKSDGSSVPWTFMDILKSVRCGGGGREAWCVDAHDSTTAVKEVFAAAGRSSLQIRVEKMDHARPLSLGVFPAETNVVNCGNYYVGEGGLKHSVGLVFAHHQSQLYNSNHPVGTSGRNVSTGDTLEVTVDNGVVTFAINGHRHGATVEVGKEGALRFGVSLCGRGQRVRIVGGRRDTVPVARPSPLPAGTEVVVRGEAELAAALEDSKLHLLERLQHCRKSGRVMTYDVSDDTYQIVIEGQPVWFTRHCLEVVGDGNGGGDSCTITGCRVRMRKAEEIREALPAVEAAALAALATREGTVQRYTAAEEKYLVDFGGANSHWVPRSAFNVALDGGKYTRWHVGSRVIRGPTWQWGDQDGGAGNVGVVTEVDFNGPQSVKVSWRNGPNSIYTSNYRQTDLSPAPPEVGSADCKAGRKAPDATGTSISFTPTAELEALLAELHLSPYAARLAQAGYNSLQALSLANKEDLLRLDVLEPHAVLLLKRLQDSPAGGTVGGPGHSHPHPRPQRHRESPTFMLQPGPNFLELIHSARCTGNDIFLSLWEYGDRKGLEPLDIDAFSNRMQLHKDDPNQITKALLWLYTVDTWVYQECNKACREDKEEDLTYFMPFIKALLVGMPRCTDLLLSKLLQPSDQSVTLYRRTTLQPSQLQLYVEKKQFVWSGFTSTSLQDGNPTFGVHLFVILIPRAFFNKLIHLGGCSAFPGEHEILLPCNLGFVVSHKETLPSPTTEVKVHIRMQFEATCV